MENKTLSKAAHGGWDEALLHQLPVDLRGVEPGKCLLEMEPVRPRWSATSVPLRSVGSTPWSWMISLPWNSSTPQITGAPLPQLPERVLLKCLAVPQIGIPGAFQVVVLDIALNGAHAHGGWDEALLHRWKTRP